MELPPGLIHTIAQTRLFTDGQVYTILRVATGQAQDAIEVLEELLRIGPSAPFFALVRDKDEISLVVPLEVWRSLRPMLSIVDESPSYRLITFDLTLDLGLVGYLAILSHELATAGVSIYPISAFSRDHIFVMENDFDRAWKVLRDFIRSCQGQEMLSDV
ncbi:MAG: ACT domain-containing protein [Anaerolineae bacterium]|nr:ACT domain-containing protein [Anaerolineae bacterium]